MKQKHPFSLLFTAVMLAFVIFLVWYLPSVGQLRFQLSDAELSLETSRGRERKQQYEYDQTEAEIPEVRAELNEVQPRAEAASEEVAALKAQRKQLREEKKAREEGAGQEGQE